MNVDDAVIVALGSNQALGAAGPQQVLAAALARFPALGLEVVKRSRWWRSAAWPDPTQPDFLNGVAWVRTALGPQEVMDALLEIEREFGRERSEPNAPRTLDLDLIAYGREVIDAPGLQVPHPRAHERLFVMAPLAEIAPAWRHPVSGKGASDLKATAQAGRDARPQIRGSSMWWRLALLAAAAAALLFALLAPLQSISVKLTLPASDSGPATAQDVTPPDWVLWIWQAAMVAAVLLAAAWIARRIVRRRS